MVMDPQYANLQVFPQAMRKNKSAIGIGDLLEILSQRSTG